MFNGYILFVHPISHCITAKIHKCTRLEQYYFTSFNACFTDESVTLVIKNNIGRFSESVQYHKSCVVAGAVVFITDIAQTDNQIFIHLYNKKNIICFPQQERQQPLLLQRQLLLFLRQKQQRYV